MVPSSGLQGFDDPDDIDSERARLPRQSLTFSGTRRKLFSGSFSINELCNKDGNAVERIPSVILLPEEVQFTTPLPTLSLVVLSISMSSEFLSANVAAPFILFMVKGFGISGEDSEVAFWTGILVSLFFLSQFLSSIHWATLAQKYSPRAVIMFCLLGSGLSTIGFGLSRTFISAMIFRVSQGIFAGSIGVSRSSVIAISDSSNEGRAYAILGFCWGMGGISGAVIGGTFEHPSEKWPEVFGKANFFVNSPYALPCMIVSTLLLAGSFLSTFLGPDLGPRNGKSSSYQDILSPASPNVESAATPVPSELGENTPLLSATSPQSEPVQIPSRTSNYTAIPRNGTARYRTSRQYATGTDTSRRSAREATVKAIARCSRPQSNLFSTATPIDLEGSPRDRRRMMTINTRTSFVDRIVMTQNNSFASGLADFWVASAISLGGLSADDPEDESGNDIIDPAAGGGYTDTWRPIRAQGHLKIPSHMTHSRTASETTITPSTGSIEVADSSLSPRTDFTSLANERDQVLRPIIESRRVSTFASDETSAHDDLDAVKPERSLYKDIPILLIMQNGFLALHATIHEQVFISYVVTPYEGGGLGLKAGEYARLIAIMPLFQLFCQFYLFPRISPPRGPFSYLTLFRTGCLLFIPAYLTVIIYRHLFASPDGHDNTSLILSLAGSTGIRYCGTTFGYTSIAILLNYMTPPHAIPYANGVAQSMVSLARFIGPIAGGWLWAYSTQDGPSGYYFGFCVCVVLCLASVLHGLLIR